MTEQQINLTPGSPEWQRRITASKVAAILGISPWESPYSLWQQMKGNISRDKANEAQRRGHYLEPAILAWWRDQHRLPTQASVVIENEWAEAWEEQPTYTLGEWAAATPDARAWLDGAPVLVEAKSAAWDDEWGDPGTDAIPDYYLVQVQWQMHISGIHRCYIPVITGRLRFAEYVVDYDPAGGQLLEQRMRGFYDSLTGDEPPDLDHTWATFQTLKRVHPEIDKGESVDLSEGEAREYVEACAAEKVAGDRARAARSAVLARMQRAQYAVLGPVKIARRQGAARGGTSLVTVAKPADLPASTGEAA